ncbi:Endocytosis and vacuole integrity protein [Coelomomyces lativittatus]|nr:Endocytosis and vacuole integrity protein [Coelomomyces lativittatus]KAJ1518589.1 Endocytosis and vacuole integrity protein [Coelomomyces lativittatus]
MDLHLPRILKELPDQWSMVIHHFINLTGHGTNTTLQRQTCDIVCEIVMQAFLVDQAKAFIPLQELVKLNGMASKLSLDTLTRLLQMHGPQVTSWEPIYTLLESVANDEGLIRLAFPCLELMSTDYFMTQPALTCVQTVRLYAQRSGDINIALTCIRLLWHIADTASEDSFWLTVIHQLLLLCLEKRAPVRNGCVTSLLRSIANHSFLNDDQVATCYFEIMFPLLHKVVHCNLPDLTTLTSSHVIYQHHSRDTGDKQWNETRVLVIQGIEEAFAHHFKFMNDPTFQQLLIHLNVYLMETHLEVKVAVIKLVHSFLKLPITEFHAFRMYQWWFGVISQYHQATFPIPSLTSAMSSSTPSSSVSPLSSASLPTSPSFSNGQSSSLTSESTPLPSPTLPHSAPVNAPSTSIVVSHELLTLLVNLLVEMLPMISTLFSALPRTLLSKLTTVLMISQVCLNHPKDTDGLTSLQQGVFEITFFLLQSEASLPWVFETYAEWLKLTPPSLPTLNSTSSTSSCTYPTYLALSHEVLKVVVKYATQAPTGPFPNALASIFLSFHEIFQQPHVLYQGVTECWMEFLKFLPLLPTTTTTSSSSKTGSSLAVESMSTLALIFFETRPQASIETMVQDVKVIQTLIQTFPNYFVNDLSEFWNALEISTRFSVTTPLDLPNPISSSTSTVLSTSKAPVDVRDMYCMEGLRWLIRSGPIWSSAWDTSVPRMVRVVSQYVLDKQHSRIPLPRLRDVELEVVCSEALMCQYLPSSSLKDTLLTMSPTSSSSIKKDEQGELKWGLLPKLLQHHPWAHLWAMYPWLVQCVKHVTGQPALMELVCQCLEKCGSEF